jgi:hypothetical protein
MNAKDLLKGKLDNFKFLIASKIKNEENEHFVKLMEYDVDKIIYFYQDNIKPYYNTFGMNTIIRSFLSYLELDKEDEELVGKIQKYFEFFTEVITELEKETDDVDVNKSPK